LALRSLTAGILFTVPFVLWVGDALVPALLGAILGSLLPNLDAYESRLGNYQFGKVKPFKPVSRMLFFLLGHRGFLHSLLGLALLGAICLGLLLVVIPKTSEETLLLLATGVIGLLLG
jgi:membrane-bound metal-dependent hydrolase YbcI (DUF457 family)